MKTILDKHATIVIPQCHIGYDPTKKRPWFVMAKWKSESYKYQYSKLGYSEDLCLWSPPADWLVIEFESHPVQNDIWVHLTAEKCKELGFDYCICSHDGKSDYVWIANIKGMITTEERKALAKLLVPEGSDLDYTNMGRPTLVPVIEHKHWKHKTIHKIISGKNPLEHCNQFPDIVLQQENLSLSDVQISKIAVGDFVKEILEHDFTIKKLLSGNTSYHSRSEARMALMICLASYGLGDSDIHFVMLQSKGLNFQERLFNHELAKARSRVTSKRKLLRKGLPPLELK